MRALIAAIALVLAVGVVALAGADAFELPAVEATHHRAKKLVDCTPNRPIGDLFGQYEGQFVRTVAGIRLWRKDGRQGPGITYCFEVNNSYDAPPATVDPEGSGRFRLPRWMRRHAESVQIITNEQCGVRVSGQSAMGIKLWTLNASGFSPRPPTRRWRWLELPEPVDDRTVYLTWNVDCR